MTGRPVLIATPDGVRPAVAIDPIDLAVEVLADLARLVDA